MERRWEGRSAFAEYAEALNVQTDEIAVVIARGDRFVAIFAEHGDEEGAWVATLGRDADGILVEMGERSYEAGLVQRILAGVPLDEIRHAIEHRTGRDPRD